MGHTGPDRDGRDPTRNARVLQHTDDARRPFVARALQPEPGRRIRVVRCARHLRRPGVWRVGEQRTERHDNAHIEIPNDAEQLGAERAPPHVRLDAVHEHQVEVGTGRAAVGEARRRPGDAPRNAVDERHRRPVDLEVVIVVRVEFGERLGVPDQFEMLHRSARGVPGVVPALERSDENRIDQAWPVAGPCRSGKLALVHAPTLRPAPIPTADDATQAARYDRPGRARPGRVSDDAVPRQRPWRGAERVSATRMLEVRSADHRRTCRGRRLPETPTLRRDCTEELTAALRGRILVLDGAMGTAIQRDRPGEAAYRGERFADWPSDLIGNNDILTLTQPQMIADIHRQYLEAGADIIETNTFNAQAISLADYGLQDVAFELTLAAARLARRECDAVTARTPERPRYVAGALGPTTRTASISPDVNDPGARNVSYRQLVDAYFNAARGLVEGGADLLQIETIFDTLNARAAIFAVETLFEEYGRRWPIVVSGTITDASGRTLSGQVTEAFWTSIRHVAPLAVGLNCALVAKEMRPYIAEIARVADCFVSCYPNAGLPNAFAEYDEAPEETAAMIAEFAASGFLNLAGGSCGTTPLHIAAIAEAVADKAPREVPEVRPALRLSGLEPLNVVPESLFVNVGERTNIPGSAKFRNLIRDGDYNAGLSVARQQVESGAQVIDVNMDEGMIDGVAAMDRFLKLVTSEPDISRIPVMIDSSKFEVIEAGLRCVQGKPIVNSISMKEGEDKFRREATLCRKYGAAVVVMAFDEEGQADNLERRKAICERAYRILVDEVGFPAEDIIFDPNIFAVATGIEEHANYGVDFIEATRWIKQNLPGAMVSGGVSNVSFSFRGNNAVREAIHAVFLYHAIAAGMDMGIVNAGALVVY